MTKEEDLWIKASENWNGRTEPTVPQMEEGDDSTSADRMKGWME